MTVVAARFSKLAYLSVGGVNLTAFSNGVPQIGKDVVTQPLTTGNADGTTIGGELEDNSFAMSLYNDTGDVVGAALRPHHKGNVEVKVQYGNPATPGTAGTASRDDILYTFDIYLVVPTPVPAGPVGSAEMFDIPAKVQGLVVEDDGS